MALEVLDETVLDSRCTSCRRSENGIAEPDLPVATTWVRRPDGRRRYTCTECAVSPLERFGADVSAPEFPGHPLATECMVCQRLTLESELDARRYCTSCQQTTEQA
jgi:hypothetical protein